MAYTIGSIHSDPTASLQAEENRDYLAEAVRLSQQAYDLLKDLPGKAKYMPLNNLVYFSCLLKLDSSRHVLLAQGRELRDVAIENLPFAAPYLLTYARVAQVYSSEPEELKQALDLVRELLEEETDLTPLQKKEAAFVAASLATKLTDPDGNEMNKCSTGGQTGAKNEESLPQRWKKAGWVFGVIAITVLLWIAYLILANSPAGEQMPASGDTKLRKMKPVELSAGAPLDGPLGMGLRFVPSDTYRIGEQDDSDATSHSVRITRGFWLAETELTQAQWRRLVRRQPSTFVACGGDCPVETINWYEAVAFANRLSDRLGLARCYELVGCKGTLDRGDYTCESSTFAGLDCLGYRLPTGVEWEVAARAGTTTAIYTGYLIPLDDYNAPELDPIAWYFGNSGVNYDGAFNCSKWPRRQYPAHRCGPHPVGQKQANAWGFRDLLGNIKEWAGDGLGRAGGIYPTGLLVDFFEPPESTLRLVRGGSWRSSARNVRAAPREYIMADDRSGDRGFRLARSHDSRSSGRRPGP